MGATPTKRAASPNVASGLPAGAIVTPQIGLAPTVKMGLGQAEGLVDVSVASKPVLHANVANRVQGLHKAGSTGATVYGFMGYDSSSSRTVGVSEVFLDATEDNYFGVSAGPQGYDFTCECMYVREDKIILIGSETFWGYFTMGLWELEYDLDGNLLDYNALSSPYFSKAAYSPEDDTVYGFTSYNSETYFASAPGDDPTNLTLIGPASVSGLMCMTVNQVTGEVLTVQSGSVVSYDKTTGESSTVGTIEVPGDYLTAIAYSPLDGGYYYGVCRQVADGGCSIDLIGEDFSQLQTASYGDAVVEWYAFTCPDTQVIEDGAPGESTLVNTVFPNGALSGSLTYRLATETYVGTPILGNINWDLEVDGKLYKHGVAAAGSEVTVAVSDLTEGVHKFTFKASLGGKYGRYNTTSFYVGNDTPCAPTNVELTETKISWDAVTEGVHSGYVDASAVTYNVYLNDEQVASGLTGTSCSPGLTAGTTLDSYVASVEAVFDGKVSERGNSNDLTYGEPFDVPCGWEPTAKESKLFTVADVNEDGSTFKFTTATLNGESINVFYYNYNRNNAADDWLFLPPVNFSTSGVYEFSMNAFRTSATYPEKYEVVLCSAADPDSQVKVLKAEAEMNDDPSAGTYDNYDNIYFTVPESKAYYIAVHATSDADEFRIFLRDFSVNVAKDYTVDSPSAVDVVSAEAAAQGALNAYVTFKFPTTTLNGAEYPAGKALKATLQAPGCNAVTVDGIAGKQVTATVPTLQGENEITIDVADGDLKGLSTTVSVRTGIDVPASVNNLQGHVSADGLTMHLTWEAPTEGVNGGYVAPTDVTYYLCEYINSSWYVTDLIGTDVYSYDVSVAAGAQAYTRYGLIPENLAGMPSTLLVAGGVMGTPNELPMLSDYKAGAYLTPIVNYGANSGSVSWYIGNPGAKLAAFKTDEAATALYSYSTTAVTNGKITFPLFSTLNAKNPHVKLNVWGQSCDEFSVYARTVGSLPTEEELLATFSEELGNIEEGPDAVVDVEIPAKFNNQGWVELSVHFTTSAKTQSFILYSLKAYDAVDNDFAVTAIEGATTAKIGQESKYTAYITNLGLEANQYTGGSWKLVDENGDLLANVTTAASEEDVEPEDVVTYDISFTPTADYPSKVYLTYTSNAGDEKEANDSLTKEITVAKGNASVVTDLHADEITHENVLLAWTAPGGASSGEGFEDEEPLVYDDVDDTVGVFKRVDRDGAMVYGIQNDGYAALEKAYQPQSFVVWSTAQMEEVLGTSGYYVANSGDKFIVAICPSSQEDGSLPAADDWLISPEVAPGSEFSFYCKPFTYQYGAEEIEIMYSTTDDDPDSFQLLETLSISGNASDTPVYEQYSYSLPANAKYFALHYVSKDIFGILLDDFDFTAAGSEGSVSGYNIYRNGAVLVSNEACPDATYNDTTVAEDTQYTYVIVPVNSDGTLGFDSNTLVIRTTGVDGVKVGAKAIYAKNGSIVVNGYEGEQVVVVAADGKINANDAKASAAETYNVGTGVFVVKAGKDVVKVIVK